MREAHNDDNLLKVESLTILQGSAQSDEELHKLIKIVNAIELGRIVTRDIGGSDPERMTAQRALEYVNHTFKNNHLVQIKVIEGQENFERDYPLFAAVNRATVSKSI